MDGGVNGTKQGAGIPGKTTYGSDSKGKGIEMKRQMGAKRKN